MPPKKTYKTSDIRKKVKVTKSDNRATDHKLELQTVVKSMNKNGVGPKVAEEIKKIVNNKLNLKSRGLKANNLKGAETKTVLEKKKVTKKKEKAALKENLDGLQCLQPLIKDSKPKTKEVFKDVKKNLKKK
eukprot:gene12377-6045_t